MKNTVFVFYSSSNAFGVLYWISISVITANVTAQCRVIQSGVSTRKLYIKSFFATNVANLTSSVTWKILFPNNAISSAKITLNIVRGISNTSIIFFLSSSRGSAIDIETLVKRIKRSTPYTNKTIVTWPDWKNVCRFAAEIPKKLLASFSRQNWTKIESDVNNASETVVTI